jgi:lysophospholipase L1-like esterase
MLNAKALVVAAACVVLLTACAAPAASVQPSPSQASASGGLIVIGHSGATGYNSDPANPGTDALANSWASGTNPDVKSIYGRLLALDPGIEGKVANAAVDGSHVYDLDGQLDAALKEQPSPRFVLIQTVDNDIACDGTDEQNYAEFEKTLTAVLQRVASASPQAKIVVVGTWATVTNYTDVVAGLPNGKASLLTGSGPCDPFDSAGRKHPERMRYQQDVFNHYETRLKAACKAVSACHEDGGALNKLVITADDLAPDYSHLSIAGLQKQAATEWELIRTLV